MTLGDGQLRLCRRRSGWDWEYGKVRHLKVGRRDGANRGRESIRRRRRARVRVKREGKEVRSNTADLEVGRSEVL